MRTAPLNTQQVQAAKSKFPFDTEHDDSDWILYEDVLMENDKDLSTQPQNFQIRSFSNRSISY